jgi:cation:H+ antiporter
MIAAYCLYLWLLIKAQRKHSDEDIQHEEKESQDIDVTPEKQETSSKKAINKKSIAFVIIGFVDWLLDVG